MIGDYGISCEIALKSTSLDLSNNIIIVSSSGVVVGAQARLAG